ncbi:predicted protein [Aspergillus nidulans FGSC A4]|uniref:Uncharacterized protein n=1 Tax=Emericella nidulans (strain FGSC A4 / ATCC 38163 / CBS 112.46 / NRRL 194 / M139) TaxID=227321 RepID=Q5BAN1_EMENI|nr:hypothetical protein [Aspergillus nidulans FGSC A4]EAA64510.1 predicted protein [Aspergillus nidulans FGSC A4]CBF86764.1 TPA: conserved hypothetical protein [Aspergillus nidulans FGSC A4]|eukprot:XP_660003.1 predicted protein [Aspergillus nidulans FGSC A4]
MSLGRATATHHSSCTNPGTVQLGHVAVCTRRQLLSSGLAYDHVEGYVERFYEFLYPITTAVYETRPVHMLLVCHSSSLITRPRLPGSSALELSQLTIQLDDYEGQAARARCKLEALSPTKSTV